MILDNSDTPEMLRLHCVPHFLQQRIDEALMYFPTSFRNQEQEGSASHIHMHPRRTLSRSSLVGGAASASFCPLDPLARGSASAHASVSGASASTNGMRMSSDEVRISSESGSGIQTPSPEVEGIIKALLSNRLDQAALGFQTIYHGSGSGTPRGGGPPLPLTKEATPTEMVLCLRLNVPLKSLLAKTVPQSMKDVMATTRRKSSSAPSRMRVMLLARPQLIPSCGPESLSSPLQALSGREYIDEL
jgi:hypothetical protein